MKEYWYKRTFADGKKGGYLKRTKKVVLEIRNSQELNKSKGYEPQFILEEAKWWYYPYRYLKDNKAALWALILVLIGAIAGSLLTYFLGTRN